MMTDSYTAYLEIAIISLLMFLAVVLIIVVLTVGIITWFKRKKVQNVENDEELEIKNAKKFRGLSNKYRSMEEEYSFPIDNDEPCIIKYKIAHVSFVPNGKLSIKLEWLKIGGSNDSVKSNLMDLKEIYFRILLNNKSINSIIISEKYAFRNHININETFIFQIQKELLTYSSFVVEAFASLKNRNEELFIGWTEVELPENFPNLPLDKKDNLQIPDRVIDLYFKSIGYLCVSLSCSMDEIKIGLLATTYLDPGINVLNLDSFKLYFMIKSKNENSTISSEHGTSTYKWFKPTIIWNETFTFKYQFDSSTQQSITISLWKINGEMSITTEQPVKVGKLKFGNGISFNKKAEDHWKSVFTNENEEIVKWHSINMKNKFQ